MFVVKHVLQTDLRITLFDIINMCPTRMCRNTIRKTLLASDIHSQIAVKLFFDTSPHVSMIGFSQKYYQWSAEDQKQVIWIDESIFEVGKNSRQIHVWSTVYERYASSCVV